MAYFWPPPRCRRSKDGFLMYQRKILEKKVNKKPNFILLQVKTYLEKSCSGFIKTSIGVRAHSTGKPYLMNYPRYFCIWFLTLKNVLELFKNFVKIHTIYRKDIIIAKYKLTIVKLLLLVVLQGLMWSALKQYLFGILKSTHGGQDQSKIFF